MKGKVINQKFNGFLKIPDFKESHRTRSVTTECLTTPVEDTLAEIFAVGLLPASSTRLQNNGCQTSACGLEFPLRAS